MRERRNVITNYGGDQQAADRMGLAKQALASRIAAAGIRPICPRKPAKGQDPWGWVDGVEKGQPGFAAIIAGLRADFPELEELGSDGKPNSSKAWSWMNGMREAYNKANPHLPNARGVVGAKKAI